MVTDIRTFPLHRPVNVVPGNTMTVTHTGKDIPPPFEVCRHTADFATTWTHSILFRLNGQMQWLLGTEETILWLKGLSND